ncbi:hypothetical protein GCM10025865_13390 [Paraoerskovia sediminicola]|uniref:PAS domain S-box-containing protein n=1 Tax=Paraoerskovia sediminicola TaxID=1138587 RepID=A0ABN6XAT5_9CELL|nr:hypothetical protein GCM10025865_13390 [Paraoerskovia sediminicola]
MTQSPAPSQAPPAIADTYADVPVAPPAGLPANLPADIQRRAANASDLSFTISDPTLPDNPLIWVNPAFERVTGYRADEVLGRNCRFLQSAATDADALQRIRDALAENRTSAETLLNVRRDGTPFWNQVVISPVLDDEGRTTHHVGIQADVTSRVREDVAKVRRLRSAEQQNDRLRLLATITQQLLELFDDSAGAELLPRLVAPHFGDWCFVTVVDDTGRQTTTHIASADPLDPTKAAAVETLTRSTTWLERSPMINHVLAAGNDYLPAPYANDLGRLPERTERWEHEALLALGVGTSILVPLRGRDRALGMLTIVSGSRDAFDRDDVRDITALGARAGLALDNARLFAAEHDRAVTLQRSMLPVLPEVPGLDCAASYLPASARAAVGGDWYDVIPLPGATSGSRWATWSGTTSGPQPRWASCARCCAPAPGPAGRRARSSTASTGSSVVSGWRTSRAACTSTCPLWTTRTAPVRPRTPAPVTCRLC